MPDHPSQIACCLEEVPTPEGWNAREFAAHQPWEQILIWCASNALRDAGLWEDRQSRRIGLVLGVGGEWIVRWTQDVVDNIGSIYSPQFVKDLKGPQPWTSIMPTGGITATEESLKAWFAAGVTCVGLGSQLISKEVLEQKDYTALENKVREALEMVKRIRA